MTPGTHEFFALIKSLFRRRRIDDEMAEELKFHQTLLREKFERQGMAPAEAAQATRLTFGNPSRWHERLREQRQFKPLENLLRDFTFASRVLKKSPGFLAVSLLTLALGVGANTAVFSMINALLLRPLSVPDSEHLAILRFEDNASQPNYVFCTPFFRDLEKRHDIFENVFAYNPDVMQVQGRSGNENIQGVLVSGQFFTALQTPPRIGRYLTPVDDQPGGSPDGLAVVISESFWDSWFDRVPDVVGRKLTIANVPFTVVGVMPKKFRGVDPTQRPDIFVPLSADPIIDSPRNHIDAGIHAWWINVMGRLRPDVSLQQANAALLTISSPILHGATSDASYIASEERGHFHFSAESGSHGFTYARLLFRNPLLAMLSMCGGILLLACLNLTSLLMARAAARERELATRLALGASRRRLIQQLLMESLLIALAGTALGLVFAPAVSHSVTTILTRGNIATGAALDTSLDIRVFGFAALLAIAATLLIGLLPALHATGANLNEQIKDGQHPSEAFERKKLLPRFLMASEVALALVLVTGAGLLTTSLVRLYKSGIGFDPSCLVNITFSMDKQLLEGDRLLQLYRELGDALSHQPGVKSASFEFIVPLSHRGWNDGFFVPGGDSHLIWLNSVGPRYFETMRIPLLAGREFMWTDTKTSGPKIILNQSAAKLLFNDKNALGRQVINKFDKAAYEVVAVVGNARYRDMRSPAPAAAYVPISQDPQKKPSLTAVLRVEGPQAPLANAARTLSAQLAPSIPPPNFSTMDEIVNNSISTERMLAILAFFFSACALLVTAIGLYGTLSYTTARRTNEIGIRMALGAQRSRVVAMIFGQNAIVTIIGSTAGLFAALLASGALASFLYETSPRDPWVFVGSVAALAAVACAASLLPAVRASQIEPIAAIRYE
jgi:predicted permease